MHSEAKPRRRSIPVTAGNVATGTRPDAAAARRAVLHDVHRLAAKWRMLHGVRRLAVAVSGGADSAAPLDALASLTADDVGLIPVFVLQYPEHQDAERLAGYVLDRHALRLEVIEHDTREAAEPMISLGKAPCRQCAPLRADCRPVHGLVTGGGRGRPFRKAPSRREET